MTHLWNDERTQRMGEMIRAGHSLEQVGAAFNRPRHGVAHRMEKLGIKSRFSQSLWTPEKIEELTRLFQRGLSSSSIAAEMHLTRNAVIGKLSRLGLTSKNGFSRLKNGRSRPQRVEGHMNGALALQVVQGIRRAKGARVRTYTMREADVQPQHVSFLDTDPGGCRFPYGDGPFTFCNCPSIEGSSYCEPHHQLTHSQSQISAEEFAQHQRAFRAKMVAEAVA
jgi:GcrA cell cycle regulator